MGQDPQLPQGFYPVAKGVSFLPGDQLSVTCEFDSMSRNKPTYAGSTSKVRPQCLLRLAAGCWLLAAGPSTLPRGWEGSTSSCRTRGRSRLL